MNDPGPTVKGKVRDKDGGVREYQGTAVVTNANPIVTSIALPPIAVPLGSPASLTAKFTDVGVSDTHTYSIDWDWDLLTGMATPGSYTKPFGSLGLTEPTGAIQGSLTDNYTYPLTGVYTVRVTVKDNSSGTGSRTSATELFAYVIVFDASGGFVTGGGWIDSPPGSCNMTGCTTQTVGKANFGFVSKYKKGQSTPDGNTEFQFKAGDINFHSTAYEWLVVAGARAQFKGSGQINGSGSYGFMISAVDGQVSGGGGIDKFRIKIWLLSDPTNVVYDNQMGAAEDGTPTTSLGGGSINIQAK